MLDPALITRLTAEAHGFKHVQHVADELLAEGDEKALSLADELFASDIYQVRMCAVHIYGVLSARHKQAYDALADTVILDDDWRVQEMLAKAFDRYCADVGYEAALPIIRTWLTSKNANQRRAVSEGLRIWTSRPYFRDNPSKAIQLLATLKADESKYVRTSAGNALRDISKKHPELIRAEVQQWDTGNGAIAETYKLASKFVIDKSASR